MDQNGIQVAPSPVSTIVMPTLCVILPQVLLWSCTSGWILASPVKDHGSRIPAMYNAYIVNYSYMSYMYQL
jgi:hypothetical protein